MPPAVPRLTRTCVTCGRPFARTAAVLRQRPARYCSRACHLADPALRLRLGTAHVPGDGCWRWTGATDRDSRPVFAKDGPGSRRSVARYAYAATYGRVPPGHIAMPSCGEPRWVHPNHLVAVRRRGPQRRPSSAALLRGVRQIWARSRRR